MPKDEPEMTASDVIEIVRLLDQNRIDVWIDGGWGVDALLGEQTRSHRDLDIAVQHGDVPRLRALLEARGASLKFHDFESGNAMTVLAPFARFSDRL
jgi:hypothetical protein